MLRGSIRKTLIAQVPLAPTKKWQIFLSAAEEKSNNNPKPTKSSVVPVCTSSLLYLKNLFVEYFLRQGMYGIYCPTYFCTETYK